MEGDVTSPEIKFSFTAETCQELCKTKARCLYYEYSIEEKKCFMYPRTTKICRGILGSSKKILNACGNKQGQFCTD